MNKKIKLISFAILASAGVFLGANSALAYQTTVVTCTSATVFATITSTNGASTNAWFEWSSSLANVISGWGTKTQPQPFNTPQDYSQSIYNLNPGSTYYYRAMVSNIYGAASGTGTTYSFTTPSCTSVPVVSTDSASSISQTSATLNGYVTSNSLNTTAWFEYGTTQSFGSNTSSVNYGTTATSFSGSTYNLNPNTTYYYRAVAQSSQGPVYGNVFSFTTTGQTYNYSQPYVTTNSADSVTTNSSTLNGYVSSNGSNSTSWFEWGTSYSLGNTTPHVSYWTTSTSFNSAVYNLNPNTTYYYRAVAQNSYGTGYGSTLSFLTGAQMQAPVYNTYGVAPTVSTLLATELTGNTAKLNGLVFTAGSQSSTAWYEWGTTTTLENKTAAVNVGNLPAVKHSEVITSLVQGQKYYYRVVSENSFGRAYGTINSFVSSAVSYVVVSNPAPIKASVTAPAKATTTVVAGDVSQSYVSLSIDGGVDTITPGEKRTYQISWKNESRQNLKNVVLRIVFPPSMTVNGATKGSFSEAENTVVVKVDTLAVGEDGNAFVFATSGRSIKAGDLIVITADIIYTNEKGLQGDALAYVTHTVGGVANSLGASAFNSGSFIPTTLFEWILLIVLVLVLVLLGNHAYARVATKGLTKGH